MCSGTVSTTIAASVEEVFDLIHDYKRRLDWDPFLREAILLDHAQFAGTGVASRCSAKWLLGGASMVTEYVTFKPGRVAAVKMTMGPFFLNSFAASIRHQAEADDSSRVTYRYCFQCSPTWLSRIIRPVVQFVFYRETVKRLNALKRYMESS